MHYFACSYQKDPGIKSRFRLSDMIEVMPFIR